MIFNRPKGKEKMDVTVAIPVHNEKGAVRQCIIDMKNNVSCMKWLL